ncbi:MAG: acetyl-CoA C-acyltransferase [Caldilineaceae bacterium]|nr:acetyl-CoA C-acyltransferase [Caldilineaceae bacterium]MBP8108513.1 acetyl-CoA C-acyltransferase [Caldilineaceae bacterium]MBP8123551.1 acetyl-CoA C-acyltransferase [Caldilineaceae bacterium]MBP9074381.1 acetyl-CoA C-acyltransferase [Caldilineaceae bacterium]
MTPPTQPEVWILSAARTPIGRLQGGLQDLSAAELGAAAIRAAVERAKLPDLAQIDEVIMGNVVSAGLGQNIARQTGIRAGLPTSVGAMTINKVCGASLKAAALAAQAIRVGDGNLFVVGGVESMSQAPHLVDGRRNQLRYGSGQLRDALVVDGLWCAFEDWAMGHAAEFIADEYGVTRLAMDEYALASHRKAIAAADSGKFDAEIAPVTVTTRKGEIITVSQDESLRRNTSLDALSALPPAFRADGRVTAGNAPGLNDAAAALVISSRAKAEEMGAVPLARLVGFAQKAMDPKYIFDAPAKAIPLLLEKVGWALADVDLFEVNEAFAAQILANGYALADAGWDWDKVNIHGGAIALGHPLGATGARLLTTLLYALQTHNLRRGVASLCLGGGEAVAVAVERMG